MQTSINSVPEEVRNILIPIWDQEVLARRVDGLHEFFELMTHNAPTGDDKIILAKREIIQAIRLSGIKHEFLVWLGSLEHSKKIIHVWLLPLPEEAIIPGESKIRLPLGSEPTSAFCTQALEAVLVSIDTDTTWSYSSECALDLLQRHIQAIALPEPYDSPTD